MMRWLRLLSAAAVLLLPFVFGPTTAVACGLLDPSCTTSRRRFTPAICKMINLFMKSAKMGMWPSSMRTRSTARRAWK